MRNALSMLIALIALSLTAPAAAWEGAWYFADVVETSTPECLVVEHMVGAEAPNELSIPITNTCQDYAIIDCVEAGSTDLCGTPMKLMPGERGVYTFAHDGEPVEGRTIKVVVGEERGKVELEAYEETWLEDCYVDYCGVMCAVGGQGPADPSAPLGALLVVFGALVIARTRRG